MLYAVHYCGNCGWQSDVVEDTKLPVNCPTCKRPLHQARSPNKEGLQRVADKAKATLADGPAKGSAGTGGAAG